MRVEAQSAGEANPELAASLDALHRDVYANNMAPYWVVDRSGAHDEDRQVAPGRKANPLLRKIPAADGAAIAPLGGADQDGDLGATLFGSRQSRLGAAASYG